MTATACTLAVLLAFEAASAPAAKKEECELSDDRCKAALYERRSMTAADANHRAQYLFNAHNLYLRLFDKTGNASDLCAARRAIEASLAVADQPETLRSESEALRTKRLARAKQQGARCASKTKRPVVPAEAPLVARGAEPVPADAPMLARATVPTGPSSVTIGAPTNPPPSSARLPKASRRRPAKKTKNASPDHRRYALTLAAQGFQARSRLIDTPLRRGVALPGDTRCL